MKMKLALIVLSLVLCAVKATPFEYVIDQEQDETGIALNQLGEELDLDQMGEEQMGEELMLEEEAALEEAASEEPEEEEPTDLISEIKEAPDSSTIQHSRRGDHKMYHIGSK